MTGVKRAIATSVQRDGRARVYFANGIDSKRTQHRRRRPRQQYLHVAVSY